MKKSLTKRILFPILSESKTVHAIWDDSHPDCQRAKQDKLIAVVRMDNKEQYTIYLSPIYPMIKDVLAGPNVKYKEMVLNSIIDIIALEHIMTQPDRDIIFVKNLYN